RRIISRARHCAHVSRGGPIVGLGPHGIREHIAVPLLHPLPGVRAALGNQPGVAILSDVFLPKGERFAVVTEGKRVLAISSLIDLISEAVELTLVRIELPFADERIVLCEY